MTVHYPTPAQRRLCQKIEDRLMTLYDMKRQMRDTANGQNWKDIHNAGAQAFAEAIDVVRNGRKGRL